MQACFKINLNGYDPSDIDYFEIEWDDNQIERLKASEANGDLRHVYELQSWPQGTRCGRPETFDPKLITFTKSNPREPASNSSAVNFRMPPRTGFNLNTASACVNEPVEVSNSAACDGDEVLYNFGNGFTSVLSGSFDKPGQYIVVQQVTNQCETKRFNDTITIYAPPTALPEAIQGVTITGTPLTVCLDGGGAQIIVSGLRSPGATSFSWEWTQGPTKPVLSREGGAGLDTFTFSRAGTYTLELTATNPCSSDVATLEFEVFEAVRLTLNAQPDACAPIQYTPSPLIPGATYKINDRFVTRFPVTANFGNYKVVATFTNSCGNQQKEDDFTIAPPAAIRVTAPDNNAAFCLGANPIALQATPAGGRWIGSPDIDRASDGTYTFNPSRAGPATLTYVTGSGTCERRESRTISIERHTLVLTPQDDSCIPLSYRPSPFIPEAEYMVDGMLQSDFPTKLDPGVHTVSVTQTNACGPLTLTDTFLIAEPQPITVSSPTSDTTVCAGSGVITLSASPAGGTWSGAPSIAGSTFTPTTAGNFALTYSTGVGDCKQSFTRNVVVESLDVTLDATDDSCVPISYTPSPAHPTATYTVDGRAVSSFPVNLAFGEHVITASQTNVCGSLSLSDTVVVAAPETISVALPSADTVVCVGDAPVQLRANLAGGSWSGAGGIASVSAGSTSFTPEAPGTYTLTYTRGAGACVRSDAVTVEVQGVSVDISDIAACEDATSITLTSLEPGGVWTSTECPTCIDGSTFEFPSGGASAGSSFDVTYTLTNATGCVGNGSARLEVLAPRAGFEVATQVCVGAAVSPTLSQNVQGQSVTWTVDGQPATPPFRNLAIGAHTIASVAVIGDCRASFSESVEVIAPPPPLKIVADVRAGCGPLDVLLDVSDRSAKAASYSWDFGRSDGDTFAGIVPAEAISFTNSTADTVSYRVRLSGGNACGDSGDEIDVLVFPEPVAEVGIDSSLIGCSPYELVIANRSSPATTACMWSGLPGRSIEDCRDTFRLQLTAENGEPVVYPIVLTATNECGSNADTARITVLPPNVAALFNLDDQDYTVCPGEPITLVDASAPRPSLLRWDLGDGTTSSADTVRHTFERGDTTYTVRLEASTGCGYASYERQVRVLARPQGALNVKPFVCEGEELSATLTTTAPVTELRFGNGEVSASAFAKTTFDSAGQYVVRVLLTSADGCRDSLMQNVEVGALPEVLVTGFDTACVGQTLTVRGEGEGVQSASWRFSDGAVATGTAASWAPPAAGNHTGTYVARTARGCADSAAFTLFARVTPVAGFSVSGDSTCVPTTATFTDLSRGPGVSSYAYDFADGSSSAVWASGEHTYAVGGRYAVRQVVSVDGLCFDTATVDVLALPNALLTTIVLDERCLPGDAALLDVRVAADERVRVTGPGLDSTGGTRFYLQNPGSYTITATTPAGCDTTSTYELAPRAALTLTMMPDTLIQFGDSVELYSSVNYADLDYNWQPAEAVLRDGHLLERPTVRPGTSTTYDLNVSDGVCAAIGQVRVDVEARVIFEAPTAFSPNGDGNNDTWDLYATSAFGRLNRLRIYSRWGEVVHQVIDVPPGTRADAPAVVWDGMIHGEPANAGVYIWRAEGRDFEGNPVVLEGDVAVWR